MLSIASNATPSRIAIHSGARQKAGVKDEPPAKRRIRLGKLWWWMVAILLAVCGWQAWREYDYRSAVREAKEAGLIWQSEDPISLIRQDWRNLFSYDTWRKHERSLTLICAYDITRSRDLILRLRPTKLSITGGNHDNLDMLKGLTSLQKLHIDASPPLHNLDALKSLTGLQTLYLGGCDKIPAAALRELHAALPNTYITFPDGSNNPPQ